MYIIWQISNLIQIIEMTNNAIQLCCMAWPDKNAGGTSLLTAVDQIIIMNINGNHM